MAWPGHQSMNDLHQQYMMYSCLHSFDEKPSMVNSCQLSLTSEIPGVPGQKSVFIIIIQYHGYTCSQNYEEPSAANADIFSQCRWVLLTWAELVSSPRTRPNPAFAAKKVDCPDPQPISNTVCFSTGTDERLQIYCNKPLRRLSG